MEYKEIVWYGLSCVYTSQHWGDCWYSGVLLGCQRQAQKLILGRSLAAKTRVLFFNMIQSRDVNWPSNWT